MAIKDRVKKLEKEVKSLGSLREEISILDKNINGLMEYLGSETLKRKIAERAANTPTNRSRSKSAKKEVEKSSNLSKIKARLKKLGCELDTGKSHVKVSVNGKKIAVVKNSGRIEYRRKVDGVTGWKECSLKKLMKIAKKKMKD